MQLKLILLLTLLACTQVKAQRPNIVYIMTDDMGYGDLSCYGRKDLQTPNIDRLASQGVKFVNAYAGAPLCTPTRVSFMSGRYPARTAVGLIEPLTGRKSDLAYGLTADVPSVATMVKQAGYKTALVGKWHLGQQPEHRPLQNGFEYFFGILSGAADYVSHKSPHHEHDLYENDSPVYPVGYLTDLITEKAVNYINSKHDKPFFLSINFNAPHWPWQAPGDQPYPDSIDFTAGGSKQTYAAMMKNLDDGIGKILNAIDKGALAENTIIIFTNDNGGERYSEHGGLSKSKATLWEGGIRVPAIVRWPNKIKMGTVSDQVVITMDWTATIMALAGAKASKDFPLDGKDLTAVLTKGQSLQERPLFWRSSQRTRHKALRMGEWKYLQDEKGEYLFNISKDSQEKNDVKQEQPEVFARLKQKYAEWESGVLKPIPLAMEVEK